MPALTVYLEGHGYIRMGCTCDGSATKCLVCMSPDISVYIPVRVHAFVSVLARLTISTEGGSSRVRSTARRDSQQQ